MKRERERERERERKRKRREREEGAYLFKLSDNGIKRKGVERGKK